jgi:hypothetical protein
LIAVIATPPFNDSIGSVDDARVIPGPSIAVRLRVMNGAVDLPLDRADLTFAASGDALVSRTVLPSGVRVLSERARRTQRDDRLLVRRRIP